MYRTGAETPAQADWIERRGEVLQHLDDRLLRWCVLCGCDLPDEAAVNALTCSTACKDARKRRVAALGMAGLLKRIKQEPLPPVQDPRTLIGLGIIPRVAEWRAAGFYATWGAQHPATLPDYLVFLRKAKSAASKRSRGVRLRQRRKIAGVMAVLWPDAFSWDERAERWRRIRGSELVGGDEPDEPITCIPIIEERRL